MWYVCSNSKSFYQELVGDECGMFVTIASLFSVFYQEREGDECGMFVTIASLSTRNVKEMNVVCL